MLPPFPPDRFSRKPGLFPSQFHEVLCCFHVNRWILLPLFLTITTALWGQQAPANPNVELPGLTGRNRVVALNDLAAQVVEREPDRAARLYSEAAELAGSLGDRSGEAAARFGLGDAHRVRGDFRSALEEYEAARRLFTTQGNHFQVGRCVRRLGDVYYFISDYDRALSHYFAALELFRHPVEEELAKQARLQTAHLLTTVGNVLRTAEDFDDALAYYRQSLEAYEEEGSAVGRRGTLYNIGNIQFDKGLLEESQATFGEVLELAREAEDMYLVSLALTGLAGVELEVGRYGAAEAYLLEALELDRATRRRQGVLSNLIHLVKTYRLTGQSDRALRMAEEARVLAQELGDRSLEAAVASEQSQLFKGVGDFRMALASLQRHVELREEILSQDRVRQLDEIRLRFELASSEQELVILKKEIALQRLMFLAAVAGLLLAVSLISLMFRSGRLRERAAKEIASKNQELSAAYARVEELSRTDELTGLANRRAMMERLRHEQARCQRSGQSYGLLLGDLDDFKQWNDRFGHGCGDALLVAVAERLRGAVREQDLVSRWGGEEFLILLPETNLAGAERVAEKIRTLVSANAYSCVEEPISLTMTLGVSVGGRIEVDEALTLADKALYEGKRGGKNRVVPASSG